jgi:hypothetical protein
MFLFFYRSQSSNHQVVVSYGLGDSRSVTDLLLFEQDSLTKRGEHMSDKYLKRAILHTVSVEQQETYFSDEVLDFGKEYIYRYITDKLNKISNSATKTGILNRDGQVDSFIEGISTDEFIQRSKAFTQYWAMYYMQADDSPSSDVLNVLYEIDGELYFALMRISLRDQYTHKVEESFIGSLGNDLILNRSILSPSTTRPDEAIAIKVSDLSYELVEKRFQFSGEKHLYFSEYVLGQSATPSLDTQVNAVKKLVKSIGKKYDDEEFLLLGDTKKAINDSIEEHGSIDVNVIAKDIFKGNRSAELEFKEEIENHIGVNPNLPTDARELAEGKFRYQRLKLNNGIEISIPIDLWGNNEAVVFINNPDGTVSITIKNVEEIINKF